LKKYTNLSILLAEDEPDLSELIADEFVENGAKVEITSNGNLAWEMLQKKHFDIVLSDVRMPDGDGIDLVKKIHQMKSPKPSVFIYSGLFDLSIADIKSYGVLEVFSKPYDLHKIMDTILILHNASIAKKTG
jgi:two-component system response regulator PilR (NtrC family)